MNELIIKISGEVLNSNLDEFKAESIALIKKADHPLICDADFVAAEKTVKDFSAAEKAIVAAKTEALKETADIKKLFNTLDEISANLRTTRLSLDKQVKTEKSKRKSELIKKSVAVLQSVLDSAKNKEVNSLFKIRFNILDDAVSGKRNLESMQKALDDVVGFESRSIAKSDDRISDNKAILSGSAYPDLFQDIATLVILPTAELELTVTARTSSHKLEVKKREEEKAAADKAAAEKKAADEEAAQKKRDEERATVGEVAQDAEVDNDNKNVHDEPHVEQVSQAPSEEKPTPATPAAYGITTGGVSSLREEFSVAVIISGTKHDAELMGEELRVKLGSRACFRRIVLDRVKK